MVPEYVKIVSPIVNVSGSLLLAVFASTQNSTNVSCLVASKTWISILLRRITPFLLGELLTHRLGGIMRVCWYLACLGQLMSPIFSQAVVLNDLDSVLFKIDKPCEGQPGISSLPNVS